MESQLPPRVPCNAGRELLGTRARSHTCTNSAGSSLQPAQPRSSQTNAGSSEQDSAPHTEGFRAQGWRERAVCCTHRGGGSVFLQSLTLPWGGGGHGGRAWGHLTPRTLPVPAGGRQAGEENPPPWHLGQRATHRQPASTLSERSPAPSLPGGRAGVCGGDCRAHAPDAHGHRLGASLQSLQRLRAGHPHSNVPPAPLEGAVRSPGS